MVLKLLDKVLLAATKLHGSYYWQETQAGLLRQIAELREEIQKLDLDAYRTGIRKALDKALVPGVVPYPLHVLGTPPFTPYEESLRAGGRVVPDAERIAQLAEARDYSIKEAMRYESKAKAAHNAEQRYETMKFNNGELTKALAKTKTELQKIKQELRTISQMRDAAVKELQSRTETNTILKQELEALQAHIKNFASNCLKAVTKT